MDLQQEPRKEGVCPMDEAFLPVLERAELFDGCSREEIAAMLGCLQTYRRRYGREDTVYASGDRIQAVGLVLQGAVRLEKEDAWGNRSILGLRQAGDCFGAVFACLEDEPLGHRVAAAEPDTEVLFLELARLIHTCPNSCSHHDRLVRNYLYLLARDALQLTRKLEHTSQRTTRGKLLSYLSEQSQLAGSRYFTIPLNRQELADYLAVDRSAMSAELSRLRQEGYLDYERSHFHLMEQGGQHAEAARDRRRH